MHRLIIVTLLASLALISSSCASSKSGDAYERRQGRTVQDVQGGTVESVRPVLIEGTKSGVGTAAGGIAGGIIGRGGGGRGDIGRAVGGVAGAVVGGIAGAAAEEGFTREKGYEIIVRLEGGRLIAVTQSGDEQFKPGDKVHIIQGQGVTRITHSGQGG
jgi:outer membrane lipoprotein SlyB